MMHIDPTFNEQSGIFTAEDATYVPDPKGIGHAFFTQMRRNRHKIAQYDVDTGAKETFGELLKRCVRTALEMRNRDIRPGDIVSICAPNSLDNLVPYIASQLLGAVVASLDPSIPLADTVHLLKQTRPKMAFAGQESEELIESALSAAGLHHCEVVVIGASDKHATLGDFLREQVDENGFAPHEVSDAATTCVILYSSGTTGTSKGICINHKSVFHNGHVLLSSGCDLERFLSFATTYWVSSVILTTLLCVFGKSRCVVKTFRAKAIWQQIERARATFLFLAPSAAASIVNAGRPDGVDTTSLRDVLVAGGPFAAAHNLALRDLLPGTTVHLAYGQSEAGGLITHWRMADRAHLLSAHSKLLSSGKLAAGVACRVVDPETDAAVGPSAIGELRYKSVGMMNGYHNMDATEAFDADGWIRSGDIVYFDEDRCIFVVDRIKEMLKYQSFHVSPAKIEAVVNSHPKVHSSVVIGVPDEADGDHPMALARLRPGEAMAEDELVAFVNARIDDRHRLRAGVRFLATFPYTPSGKVKKNALRKMVLAGELA